MTSPRATRRRASACFLAILTVGLWLQGAGTGDAAESAADAIANPHHGRADLVPEGKTLFNLHCSHCHGPNAVQGERRRDLRRLTRRYGADTPAIFYRTATNGREDKGMPAWQGVLEDDTLWKIFTFLETVQKP